MEILAIGGSLWDIVVEMQTPLSGDNCYPALIRKIPGGTARNLSETLARLNIAVTLITACSKDGIEQSIPFPGMVTPILTIHTSAYAGVLSTNKIRLFSFHDTSPLDNLSLSEVKTYLPPKPPSLLFLDTNLPEEIFTYLLGWGKNHQTRIMVDPIAPSRVMTLVKNLSFIDIVSLSEREYDLFSDFNIPAHLTVLLKRGYKGVQVISEQLNRKFPSLHEDEVVSDNGAGDNFNGGFLYGLLKGHSIESAINIGQLCASWCLKSSYNVNPILNENLITDFLSSS